MIRQLLNVPSAAREAVNSIINSNGENWFVSSDPEDHRVGSGGGAANLLVNYCQEASGNGSFNTLLEDNRFLIINSAGSSRRVPAYSHTGKITIPVPVFRWTTGQDLDQILLDFQQQLYNKILVNAPQKSRVLIGSGDVLILCEDRFEDIPDADIVCFGIWTDDDIASRHGVFFSRRDGNNNLSFMLQKPDKKKMADSLIDYYHLMDSGIWLLSKKAIDIILQRSGFNTDQELSVFKANKFYDLYSEFGKSLGKTPALYDNEISPLSVKVYPLAKGEFYHFGTSKDIIKSCTRIQNRIYDQREILHFDSKPHPSIFVLNSEIEIKFTEHNENIWIENSFINKNWTIKRNSFITGVPKNNWTIDLSEGICIDVIPTGIDHFILRPYAIDDRFDCSLNKGVVWMGMKLADWLKERNIDHSHLGASADSDILDYKLFPEIESVENAESIIGWMTGKNMVDNSSGDRWINSKRVSFNEICSFCNQERLVKQRDIYKRSSLVKLSENQNRSVFYQLDLKKTAKLFTRFGLDLPPELSSRSTLQKRILDQMFRALTTEYKGEENKYYENQAFNLLREGILDQSRNDKIDQQKNILDDQIIWGRSPARLDIAGGWTDTPPYCIFYGGSVINVGVELNGQPPLQVFIRPLKEYKIVLRSIDLGFSEDLDSFSQLNEFNLVGSPFSIPKAALCLSGFGGDYSSKHYNTLTDQLEDLGCGLEISILSAIPKGSGLGTSSLIAATVLGTLSEAMKLDWDKNCICNRTLALEQMLTTGGGWQDQYGGVFHGLKEISSTPGINQKPSVKWLPDDLFTSDEYRGLILLYYTGVTRVAKTILAEIVKGMFVNSREHLDILSDMKLHVKDTFNAIQKNDFEALSRKILKSWELNKRLDSGTNPVEIQKIIDLIDDYTFGYKLLGAGGGGFLLIMSKDFRASVKIKDLLEKNKPNDRARFVDITLSKTGFIVSKS